ncbi:hypothetical protein MRX96_005877 [Rhipicephalus microplus]
MVEVKNVGTDTCYSSSCSSSSDSGQNGFGAPRHLRGPDKETGLLASRVAQAPEDAPRASGKDRRFGRLQVTVQAAQSTCQQKLLSCRQRELKQHR